MAEGIGPWIVSAVVVTVAWLYCGRKRSCPHCGSADNSLTCVDPIEAKRYCNKCRRIFT